MRMHHCFFIYQIDLEIVFPVGEAIDNLEPLIVFRWEKGGVRLNVVKTISIIVSSQAVPKRAICVAALQRCHQLFFFIEKRIFLSLKSVGASASLCACPKTNTLLGTVGCEEFTQIWQGVCCCFCQGLMHVFGCTTNRNHRYEHCSKGKL